jgi:hypothetical protein
MSRMIATPATPSDEVTNRPTLRSRPLRLSGTPIERDSRAFAAETPTARRQENEKP